MYYVGYAVTTLPNEIRELQCSRGGREKKAVSYTHLTLPTTAEV